MCTATLHELIVLLTYVHMYTVLNLFQKLCFNNIGSYLGHDYEFECTAVNVGGNVSALFGFDRGMSCYIIMLVNCHLVTYICISIFNVELK